MAKQIHKIWVERIQTQEGPSEDLRTTGVKDRYIVSDDEDVSMKSHGRIILPELEGTDTLTTWWAAVVQACKDDAGIS